ncbi:MAG: GAF domain-containing protein [Elusimicrobia bacterium]|nr:GAF domain-containing protein [Elusimicrobiota bacterium]
MTWTTWVPASICLLLLAALGAALKRLYEFQAARPEGRGRDDGFLESPEGWEKLDELLSILLNLQEYGLSHTGAVSREDFAKTVLEISCRFMRCARGSIMLWDGAAGCLRIVAAKNPFATKGEKLFKPGEGVAGKAFASGQAIYVAHPEADPRYIQTGPEGSEPFISIPLLVKSKPVGVLNLHATSDAESFTGYKAKFLNILAGEAAVMLHNQDLLDNLQTVHLEMVQGLARAVDSKDAYPKGHSDQARAKARCLAQELQLPDQMARDIEYAALLHDIGKISVDQSILLKPGKLTNAEYEAVKLHPVLGHQILAPVKSLGPVARMVLYHQEWYDGRGYPEGLKGEAIPLGARMVAVIDAWEAMRSDRPYRKALPREAAVAELRRCAGTQFDPRIVEAFLRTEPAEEARRAAPAEK